MRCVTYILRSEKSGTYYRGSCENLEQRLAEHNAGRVRSTRAAAPWVVQYAEEFTTRGDAIRRERFFKTRSGYRWLKRKGII
ncbi:MAG: GIY-YIG nuclease family protein [Verrucomicrobiota bacterium]